MHAEKARLFPGLNFWSPILTVTDKAAMRAMLDALHKEAVAENPDIVTLYAAQPAPSRPVRRPRPAASAEPCEHDDHVNPPEAAPAAAAQTPTPTLSASSSTLSEADFPGLLESARNFRSRR